MFLSNYFKKQTAIARYGLSNNSSQTISSDIGWKISKATDSSIIGKVVCQQSYKTNSGSATIDSYQKYSFYLTPSTFSVGSGDTPVDFDDYILDNDISSSFSDLSFSKSIVVNDDLNCSSCIVNMTGKNNSGSEQTIKEIGLYMYTGAGRYQEGSGTIAIDMLTTYSLMVREVLATPLIVPAGSLFSITLQLNY